MELIILNSRSAGNGYILRGDAGEILLFEAGVNLLEVKKALNFKIDKVLGALISHEHQ